MNLQDLLLAWDFCDKKDLEEQRDKLLKAVDGLIDAISIDVENKLMSAKALTNKPEDKDEEAKDTETN